MMSALTWLLACLSMSGVILNIRKDRRCFALWLVANSAWAVVDFAHDLPAQAALQSVYAGLSMHGWRKWRSS